MPAEFEPVADKIPGRYIVVLKKDANKHTHIDDVKKEAEDSEGSGIASDFVTLGNWAPEVINGYACKLGEEGLEKLLNNPDVAMIVEDGYSSVYGTRDDVPWGLQRISQTEAIPADSQQPERTTIFTYGFTNPNQFGPSTEVDIYVVDTGIYTKHSHFKGCARWGFSSSSSAGIEDDDHGHGTHVAGTIASTKFGVAPVDKVKLVGVKVYPASGKGPNSQVLSGLDWIGRQYDATPRENRRPTIINMSLSGHGSVAIDMAVTALVNMGIHVVVAAGNSGADASKVSPARAEAVITVGASDISDHMWDDRPMGGASNYGASVDIVAPGSKIISCGIEGPNSRAVMSGTSMAAPHVTGIIASLILRDGNVSPKEMKEKIKQLAVQDALKITPAFADTPNLLAYNGGSA